MLQRLYLLFATVFLFCGAGQLDYFRFDSVLTCAYKYESYGYVLQWKEYDTIIADTDLTRSNIFRTKSQVAEFSMGGQQSGDQWLSFGYEVYAVLWHDCTRDRRMGRLLVYLKPLCPIGKGVCNYHFVRNVTDGQGEFKQYCRMKHDMLPFV